jgi:hypothetical protein
LIIKPELFQIYFMNLVPYRPAAYYRRQIAATGSDAEVRQTLRETLMELERLRAWVREQGMVPPVFSVPRAKVCETLAAPLTEYQQRLVNHLQ